MKRLASFLLIWALLICVAPIVHAYSGPASSSNINNHFYVNAQRWAVPINSTLAAEGDSFIRVEYVGDSLVVEYYDQDLNYLSGKALALELPIYGGVYMCDDYNFVVVGQKNTEEDDTKEVFRIIRYTKDWERVDSAGIFGANTTVPFDAGSVRFDRSGDILYIRTAHEMYTSSDGLNHQANVMIAVRISDMTVTDQLTDVLNLNYGYVSHSFNQFVRVDGTNLLAVDHGDYYPRSVVLIKYGKPAGQENFFGPVSYVNALSIVDSTYHYNDTGVSVGGFECSSTNYLIAGCSYDQKETANLISVHRNIFVTATPKDDFTDEATTIHWLTDYSAEDDVTVSPPHLVKLAANRFLLTWTENDVLKYCFLNGSGQPECEIRTHNGALSDCVPILDGNRVLWYVTNNSAPVFYEISLSDTGEEPHTHSYSDVVTAPTCTEKGYTTHTCACGDTYVDSETKALDHDMGEWTTTEESTCTEAGSKRRDCSRCDYFETEEIEAIGHDYESVVTDPTCTEKGYTTHTCACGDTYVDSETKALNHDMGEWTTTKEATCTEAGSKRRDCSRCDHFETEEIQSTGHNYVDGFCACGDKDPDYTEPTPDEPDPEPQGNVIRLAGANRHATSLLVANQMKEVLGITQFDAVIIADGYGFADALAGSYLSTQKTAPILLSYGQGGKYAYLDEDNIAYINSNLKPGGTVYILGGEKAVPTLYENALSHYTVKRLGGENRFETNLLILKEAGVQPGQEILVCTGTEFADSLSASAAGLPILLVYEKRGSLYDFQAEYLASLGGQNRFCIIGGEAAVGTKIQKEVSKYGAVDRLAGTNRFVTSVMVAEKYFPNATSAVVAYGWNFPDGLCGGALAYAMKAPLILTYPTAKYYAIAAEYTNRKGIESGVVLGGETLVSQVAVDAIF